jgi:hypothetical protein
LEPAGIDVDDAFNHGNLNGSAEAKVTCMGSGNFLGVAPLNNLDHLSHQQVDNELGDLRDEVALVASPKNALIRAGSENLLGVAPENNLYHVSHQQVDDELADWGDEVVSSVPPKSAVMRRKLRMVLDLEDD